MSLMVKFTIAVIAAEGIFIAALFIECGTLSLPFRKKKGEKNDED